MNRCLSQDARRRGALLGLLGMALLSAAVLAPGAQAKVQGFQSLAPSSVELTAVATDPGSGLVYAQENNGKSFFVYDPRTNVWSELTEAPIDSGNNGGATYLAGKIYTSYTGNEAEIGVYDIVLNSWTTLPNPLGEGTGDITAGNGKLYLALGERFVQYDPATSVITELGNPPPMEVECNEGFEEWGGLQFDGDKIYGHQGDGCSGFAVYDIASNTWQELPFVPEVEYEPGEFESAVLGSALNPVTNTYLTYGPYEEPGTLFRYDLDAGSWSTVPMPFEVQDGGMAYVALPGIEGVYMVQGENGTEFTRYTEQNVTDLSPSMSAAVATSASGGEITYSIQVKNNGPEHAGGVVLADSLPAGTTLVSAVPSQGSCAGTSSLTCSLGALRSGTTANLTIKVASGFGTVTNTATVSSRALDSNPANDSATVTATVTKPAPARCVVPKVRGLRLKAAKKALRAAHCKPGKVAHRYSAKVKKGRVIRAAKHRGTLLSAGRKVKLSVSRGAKHKLKGAH